MVPDNLLLLFLMNLKIYTYFGKIQMAPGRSTRSRREEFTPTVQHKGPLSSLLRGGDSEVLYT